MHSVYANMKIEKSRIGNRIELKIVSADLKEFFRQCISIYPVQFPIKFPKGFSFLSILRLCIVCCIF